MSERELLNRVKIFSYDVYNCVKKIKQDVYNKQLIEQLIDSAFSAAANYRASQRGKSKRDALNKIKISLEEIDESNFWLNSLFDLKITESEEVKRLINESDQLTSIFVAIVNKLEM
ncbi:MAG: four helix bundle protein [Bacteroidetes bacterium]|jgi:four helix bundle protein|nr:four helix bundle protein [Bacteroidota bacterium]MBP8915622.1 four helix bundle protein [Chitinophagales bacterium]MBP9796300.1 four helix bundle protein [Chitinophagales bacterium]